jgi:hypothetical protein
VDHYLPRLLDPSRRVVDQECDEHRELHRRHEFAADRKLPFLPGFVQPSLCRLFCSLVFVRHSKLMAARRPFPTDPQRASDACRYKIGMTPARLESTTNETSISPETPASAIAVVEASQQRARGEVDQ